MSFDDDHDLHVRNADLRVRMISLALWQERTVPPQTARALTADR